MAGKDTAAHPVDEPLVGTENRNRNLHAVCEDGDFLADEFVQQFLRRQQIVFIILLQHPQL